MKKEIKNIKELKKETALYANLFLCSLKLEHKLNQKINRLREHYAAKITSMQEHLSLQRAGIEQFVKKEDVIPLGRRSLELPHVLLGFRKSTEIVLPPDKDFIARLETLGLHLCIENKKSIKKSVFSSWKSEDLKQIGIERREKDSFFIEVKHDKQGVVK